jgi:hypothetical protein
MPTSYLDINTIIHEKIEKQIYSSFSEENVGT